MVWERKTVTGTIQAVTTIGMADEVNGKGYHYAYMVSPENCTGCTNCAVVCPDGVITVYRVETTIKASL